MAAHPPAKETAIYWALAIVLATAPFILFHQAPIIYAHLITEDFTGEYASAIAFTAAGLLLFYDALRAPNRGRKAISMILGMGAIFLAGEEVSWGHRQLRYLFDFSVPEWIRAANEQEELNFHNLEAVGAERIYTPGSYLLLAWVALSALLFVTRKELAARLSTAGLPLVPLRLAPACVLPPFFFLLEPVAKSDEVGELLVGVAALLFALDQAWSSGLSFRSWLPTRPLAAVMSLVVIGALGLGLAAFTPHYRMASRLETLATRDYASFGMYEQAESIFDYIYAHPSELMTDGTVLSHAELLADAGDRAGAHRMLTQAISESDDNDKAASAAFLRRTGKLYDRLGEQAQAEEELAAALAADMRALETAEGPNERAQLMLSLARTLSAQGLLDEAASMTSRAQQIAVSASTRLDIERWQAELEQQLASSSPSSAVGNPAAD